MSVTDFAYGLHTQADPATLPPGAAQIAENVIVERGDLRVREGRAAHAALPPGAASGLRALAEFFVAGREPAHRFVGVIGARVYWTDADGAAFAEIDPAVTVHPTNPVRLHQYADVLYLVDGDGPVRALSADGVFTALTDVPAPTTAPALSTNIGAHTIDACEHGDLYGGTTGFNYNTAWQDWQSNLSQFNAWRGAVVDRFVNVGACVRLLAANAMSGHARSVAFEVIHASNGGTAQSGQYWVYRQLPTPLDLSDASAIQLSFKVLSGAADPLPNGMQLVLGELDDRATWTPFDIDLTGETHNVEITKTIDISAMEPTARNAVRYIGFYFPDFTVASIDRPERTAATFLPTFTRGAAVVFGPILSNTSRALFTQGVYEFTCTYADGEGESGEYISGDFEHPYAELALNVDTLPLTIAVDVAKDAGIAATDAYVYARGGTSAEFRRIGSVPLAGDPPYRLVWDGDYAANAPTLTGYVGRPPAGCTLLCTYRNRMVYVGRAVGDSAGARDVLYFSNFGDPTRVPTAPSALQQVPVTYGGWADLERFGHDVSGLAAFGPALAVFKPGSLFLVQGDPGDDAFSIGEVTRREGCLSHESIRQVEGRLVWQARDKVLAWDGQQFEEISLQIAPTVRAYTAARQAAAFGIYDPQAGRYYLVYPGEEIGETPAGAALVWQLRAAFGEGDHPWTVWTGQPDACGLYAAHAPAPGVYLAGRDGAGPLYRVSADAAADALPGGVAPIDWQWVSGELAPPFSQLYVQVTNVRAQVRLPQTEGDAALEIALWPNNDADAAMRRAVALARVSVGGSGDCAAAQWTPPPRAEMTTIALRLARAESDITAVRRVDLACLPRQIWWRKGVRHG